MSWFLPRIEGDIEPKLPEKASLGEEYEVFHVQIGSQEPSRPDLEVQGASVVEALEQSLRNKEPGINCINLDKVQYPELKDKTLYTVLIELYVLEKTQSSVVDKKKCKEIYHALLQRHYEYFVIPDCTNTWINILIEAAQSAYLYVPESDRRAHQTNCKFPQINYDAID